MLFAMHILKDRIFKFETLNKQIKNEQDISDEKPKMYGLIYDMSLALEELSIALGMTSFIDRKKHITNQLHKIKECNSGEELKEIIDEIVRPFEDVDYSRFDFNDITISARNFESPRDIESNFVKTFASLITINSRKITVFDPACKDGAVLNSFKESKQNSILYGLEPNNHNAEKAKQTADKVIKGEMKGSRIQNDAFDIIIVNCPIKYTLNENLTNSALVKLEKAYVQNIYKYIRTDGVALITIPYYRMHKDMCAMIAKYFKNIQIVKGINKDQEEKNLIYILAQKDNSKTIDEEAFSAMRRLYDYDNAPSFYSTELKNYEIPYNYIEIETFKGSILDMEEMFKIVENSGCMDYFFKKQEVEKISENQKQPLLPFNIGQIGLVLTSGCLDGIVDEGDGNCHLVKGRVSKKSSEEKEIKDGVLETHETIANKVEINVILPNGEFKTLA